ncbi:MAG: hypothetical protein R2695_04815 [Acidimicrobiales bacterium]
MQRAAWIVAPVALIMVLFIALLATRDGGKQGFPSSNLEGRLAPAIVGTTIDGHHSISTTSGASSWW